MKVKDLIIMLGTVDPELEVYIPSTKPEFDFMPTNSASGKWLTIEESEDYPDETFVLILED